MPCENDRCILLAGHGGECHTEVAPNAKPRCPTCKSLKRDEPGPGWIASGCDDPWHQEGEDDGDLG